ncbi:hypothetical protein PoB_004653200 [Plakobranchus ocellatus]|uniref:Uncharacterized protein n=1 Tax=Plakobranchus ocellatus TaxID=259542 RepID=A0AAV4BM73_9GAST|nr:hypothetical protein PoB_004653200 [Plakobranchus ocellatus]
MIRMGHFDGTAWNEKIVEMKTYRFKSLNLKVQSVVYFTNKSILVRNRINGGPDSFGGVDGTVASESALRSAGTLLSWVRAPPSAPRPDGGP